MSKAKLFNDPIYGLIDLRYEILYDIIDETYFQRLRRIKQMGLSDLVYPGATHARFQHAIGATYLLHQALDNLERKEIEITLEEKIATSIAILCHDVGHGPFSHALEKIIVPIAHEHITLLFLQYMTHKYGDIIHTAIAIFKGQYHKKFLHQLISSQLDVDRLDYLSRDSFYSGVAEGVIGYDRIIKMMNVYENKIVIEEKGIYSIEKFLTSRYLMYMQVYLHKTSLAAEKMLESLMQRTKFLIQQEKSVVVSENLKYFFKSTPESLNGAEFIENFSLLDDTDIWQVIKQNQHHSDDILKVLCNSILRRNIFKSHVQLVSDGTFVGDADVEHKTTQVLTPEEQNYFVFKGSYHIEKYNLSNEEILILEKSGAVKKLSEIFSFNNENKGEIKSQLSYHIYPRYLKKVT